MSSLIVEVCAVAEVLPHPNADALEIAVVKGWQCLIKKGSFKAGDKVVYFPIDTVLPLTLSERIGVTKYLKPLRKDFVYSGSTPGGRVGAARLRGVVSYGLLIACEDPEWDVGRDVAAHYEVSKWQPPEEFTDGDIEVPHECFHRYTDIENLKNFPTAFRLGEEICLTEKIHGTNSRLGWIQTDQGYVWMAGSHSTRKKASAPGSLKTNLYWMPLTETVKALLSAERFQGRSVVLFGEIYGAGVQDLHYGLVNGQKAFRAFDLAVNGRYLDYDEFLETCTAFGVATVPILYRGPFSAEVIARHTRGESQVASGAQIREGVVIKPVWERHSEELGGRLILKSISDDYVLRKGGTEYH
jgi:RNA ligase (TIGR02306 family)